MNKQEKLIVFLPALNEEEKIEEVIKTIPANIEGIGETLVLVIDDGSIDKTASLASKAGAHVVSHSYNRGLGISFQGAIRYALENQADILVGIDADGQFDSRFIPELIKPIQSGEAHLVMGNRFLDGKPKNMAFIKYWGNKQISRLVTIVSGHKFQDVSCGFRAYSREALYHMNLFGVFSYTHEVILDLIFKGLNVVEHPISVRYFPERKSRIVSSVIRYAINTSKIIFRTMLDYKPLRFFGNLGALNILIGSGFVGFMLGHYFLTGAYTPYKSFGFIGLGFGVFGLVIFFIGLVADMLNRIRINQERIMYELRKGNK